MEKETCIFERADEKIEGRSLNERLSWITDFLEQELGINVWFVEILGKRWSYLAGGRKALSAFLPPKRIRLNERYGVVLDIDSWNRIPHRQRRELLTFLQKAIEKYG